MSGITKDIRAQRLLDRYGASVGLSEDGRNWLIPALDPFHDTLMDFKGYPDLDQSPAIPQLVKQTMTITCPTSITTGTWDVNIIAAPWLLGCNFLCGAGPMSNDNTDANGFVLNAYQTSSSGNPLANINALSAIAVPTGSNTNPGSYTSPTITGLSLPSNFAAGTWRCVGAGFEVYNTTPELYRGGSVICWRQGCPSIDEASTYQAVIYDGAGNLYGSHDAVPYTMWPDRPSVAQNMPGSRQWNAEAGAYVTCAINDTNILKQNRRAIQPLVMYGDSSGTSAATTAMLAPYWTIANNTVGASGIPAWRTVGLSSFDMSGAYFTGLSLQTTLTINYNLYIERFPTQQQQDLIVLAKRPPAYDPIALQMYSAIVQSLPVGVPVAENGLGDWFKGAISSVIDFVQPIASAVASVVPHPLAQGIAAGLTVGKRLLSDSSPATNSPANNVVEVVPNAPPLVVQARRQQVASITPEQLRGVRLKRAPQPHPRSRQPRIAVRQNTQSLAMNLMNARKSAAIVRAADAYRARTHRIRRR